MAENTTQETGAETLPVEAEPSVLDQTSVGTSGYEVPVEELKNMEGVDLDSEGPQVDVEALTKEEGEAEDEDELAASDTDEEVSEDDLEELKSELSEKEESKDEGDKEELFEVMGEKVTKKDLLAGYMKEKDYRQKTMQLADEKRAFESEREQHLNQVKEYQTSVQEELNLKKQFDYFLDHLEQTDPEKYQEISESFNSYSKMTKNPFFETQLTHLAEQNKRLSQKLEEIELNKDKISFESELTDLRSWANAKFGRLGFKWDEKKVAEAWANQDGDKSLKDIFKGMYSDQLLSLAESKSKLARAKAKTKTAKTIGQTRAGKAIGSEIDNNDFYKNTGYTQIAEAIVTGKLV